MNSYKAWWDLGSSDRIYGLGRGAEIGKAVGEADGTVMEQPKTAAGTVAGRVWSEMEVEEEMMRWY